MTLTELGPELHDLAVAIGILDADGGLRTGWFADPLGQAEGMLTDPARRAALGELIAILIPADPAAPADRVSGETWHPLTETGSTPQVFLTVRPTTAGGLALGLAVQVGPATPSADPSVAVTVAIGLVEAADGGLRTVVGTADGPVRARADVTVDPSGAVGFEGITLDATLTPADAARPVDLRVTVRGVRQGDRVLPPVVLDPTRLRRDVVPLVQHLLQDRLTRAGAEPGAPASLRALADHLLPLLGMGGDVPRLPVERIGTGPSVVADWFAAVLDGSAWVGHLAGLFGSGPPTGSGTDADPWRVPVADLGGGDRVELTVATRTGAAGRDLLVGVALRLHGGPGGAAVDAGATLVSLPLSGTGAARAVPAAGVLVRAPGNPAAALVDADGLHVGFAQAGLRWDGTTLRPALELGDVEFEGHTYERLDLSSVDSVRAAAADAVRAALADALGTDGPGAHLAVLAGLIAPPDEPGAPVADPVALLSAPTRELARVHRARLGSADHPWSTMLGHLAALLGSDRPVTGAGSEAEPWLAPVVDAGPLALQLAAWAGDTSSLHLGLRLAAAGEVGTAAVAVTAQSEVVDLTLPVAGAAAARVLGRHDVRLVVSGPFPVAAVDGIGLTLQGVDARVGWRPGHAPEPAIELTGLTVHVDDTDVTLPRLQLPPTAFDPGRPDLGLGLPVDELALVVRALVARLATAVAGDDGFTVSGLLGLHHRLPGLPDDWPGLALPDDGFGALLADPLEALRDWLARVMTDLSSDGTPFAPVLLNRLRLLASPDATAADIDMDVDVEGAGTWAAPWRVELAGPGSSHLLAWLGPDGPPAGWAAAAADLADGGGVDTAGLLRLMSRSGAAHPSLAAMFGGADGPSRADQLAEAVATVARALSDGDGVVPLAAQRPDGPDWTVAALAVDAAHHRLPEHADTVGQVLAQVETWAPGTVLLIGPPFAGRASWLPLLAAAEAARPGTTSAAAHFDLRSAPTPDRADLRATTVAVPWYTADLVDAGGSLDPVVAQVAAVVDRIRELRGDHPVVLVAHSTAGLAARAFTAAHPALVAGLVTIGTPHGAAPLTVLDEPAETDAVRLASRLLGATSATGPLRDAVDHLLAAAERWQAGSGLPVALSYPRDRFDGDADQDTGGVPALAVSGQLTDDLTSQLGAALAQVLRTAPVPAAPTHIGIGLRAGIGGGAVAGPGEVHVDVGLRVDAARMPLTAGAAPAPEPERLVVEVRIDRKGGWLLDPADGRGPRLRRADLTVTVEAGGPAQATAVFHDAGIDAPTTARVTLADPAGARLLAAVVSELSTAGPTGIAVVDALVALGIAARTGPDGVTVLADAVTALQADAGAFLGPRVRAALEATAGFLADPDAPLTVALADDRLTVRLDGLEVAGVEVTGELTIASDDPTPRVSLLAAGAAASLRWSTAAPSLVLDAGHGTEPVTLVPSPGDDVLTDRLGTLLAERLVTAVAGAALLDRLGPGWTLGPLTRFLLHPDRLLGDPAVPGGAPQIDGDRLGALLQAVAAGLGLPDGGLPLPGGLVLRAAGRPCVVSLRTEPAFEIPGSSGSLGVEVDVTVTELTSLPGIAGALTLDVPLGGSWGSVAIALGLDQGTVSLALTPTAGGQPLAPIVLLPEFGGLGPLAADAAGALLPALLDELVDRLPTPRPALADAVLAVADAVGIHGGPGDPSFAAHVPQLRALAGPDGLDALTSAGLPAAITQLWQVAGLPGTITGTASGVAAHATIDGVDVTVEAGWGATPLVRLRVDGLVAGPIALDPVVVGVADGSVTGELITTVTVPTAVDDLLGVRLAPSVRVTLDGGVDVRVLPLGPGTADLIEATLLPEAGLSVGDGGIVERVALPLAAQVALDRFDLDAPLFAGGPSAGSVLRSAGVVAPGSPRLVVPLHEPALLVTRLLGALAATEAVVELSDDLDLRLVVDRSTTPARLGLGLHGRSTTTGDAVEVSLRLGEEAPTWITDPAPALRLLLVEEGTWDLRPSLRIAPLGVRLAGPDGGPLLDTADVHLGAVTAYLWATIDLDDFDLGGIGAAVDLDDLGLPLGAVAAGNSSSNPVAASLLDSSGGSPGAGDRKPVAPGLSLVAAKPPGRPFALLRREDDEWLPFAERPLWFGVHRSFGPLAVDQIGVAHVPAAVGSGRPGSAAVLVDGAVKVGPLDVRAHELGVQVPLDRLDDPGSWPLDLAGLAVALRSDEVSVSGGLVKRPGPPIDYAGTLTVELAGRTFTAVGAYARPVDQQGRYTSLFVFVGLPTVLGGPPFMFITGMGAGAGYNRRLVTPTDITQVPDFPLVKAIDEGVNADPVASLTRLGAAMPPQRGSLWMAAGIRFTSFSFVRSVAVLYVHLDRGVEIGLVGVARASIPPPDAGAGSLELARVELALKARFSPAEGVLSVQAQLTDNSWLLSRDCQLTGGFAFVMWFHRDQFVLTLGGYHPAFAKPPEFPVVPRLGFHWAVSSAVVIKGEAYFALTSSCVMAGGRLEVSYRKGGIYASFVAYADFLISWDPFHYDIRIGVSVRAGFRIRICFFACVTIDVSVSLGAEVHLLGPPLRGRAVLDLEICKVTVEFGHEPHEPPTFLGWDAFREKYVVAGAEDGDALSLHATAGLVPPDAIVAGPPPGSRDNPWPMAGTFTLRSETRLAATRHSVNDDPIEMPLDDGVHGVPERLDLAPMNVANLVSTHDLTIRPDAGAGGAIDLSHLTFEAVVGHGPAAIWMITDRPTPSAVVLPVVSGITLTGTTRVTGAGLTVSVDVVDSNLDPVPIGLITPPLAPVPNRALAELQATAGGPRLTRIGAEVLGEAGAGARTRAGLAARPISALSARTLHARRSSPPLVVPLRGDVVGAGRPTPAPRAVRARPRETVLVAPAAPRLLATMRPPAPVAARTTVGGSNGRARIRPPAAPDRSLHRVGPASVAPATAVASTGRTQPATGTPALTRLAPGSLQVWDLPADRDAGQWVLGGPGAARVVFLDRAGTPLVDHEVLPGDGAEVALTAPVGASRLAIRAGELPGCGWESGTLLAQVAPTALLAHRATVHLPVPLLTRRDGQQTSQALVPAATALAGQTSSETWLPADVDLVVVIVDDGPGDLPTVTVDGADVAEPTVVAAGRRLHLIHEVTGRTDRPLLAVRVAAGPDRPLAGVLGLGAPRTAHLPDGPASPEGPVTVRYQPAPVTGDAP